MNKDLAPDQRADMVIEQMTLDEKIQLVHGGGGGFGPPAGGQQQPNRSNGGAGWIPGIPRLGIPDLNAYSGAKAAMTGGNLSVTFTVKNTGKRAGSEIAEIFAALPAGTEEPPKRLVGWEKIRLAPGESRSVTVAVEPLFLSIFDVNKDGWQLAPGAYKLMVGGSSKNLPLTCDVKLP